MSRAVAALAMLLLLASAAWLLLSDPQIADPGVPKFTGPPLQRLEASAPVVGNFELFYVNHENPFIPYDQRVRERVVYDPRPRTPRPIQPVARNPIPPVHQPAIVHEPVRKPLALPRLGQTGPNAPVCIGLVAVNGHESLTVRMPGDAVAQTIDVGAQFGGWTLLGIEGGNLARFRDPQGAEQVYPIGDGDLAVAQQGASAAPAAPAPPPKLPPGVLPRLPGSQPGVPPAPQPGDNRPRRPRPGGMNGPAQPPAELPPLIPVPKK
jgi:hypothetical protein